MVCTIVENNMILFRIQHKRVKCTISSIYTLISYHIRVYLSIIAVMPESVAVFQCKVRRALDGRYIVE